MKIFAIAALSLAALSVAGCASLPPSQMSYADPALTPAATGVVAKDMADKAARLVPPAKTTLVVSPTKQDQEALSVVVNEALRKKGFAVQDLLPPKPGEKAVPVKGVPFLYQITADERFILARFELTNRLLARAYGYSADKSSIAASGPWSNMELPK